MRYTILLLLNTPLVLMALLGLITNYKLRKITKTRFIWQILFWITILVVIIISFPIYNLITDRPALESSELSFFDIIQTTVIVFLLYIMNTQRQKIDAAERRLRDLHQEISIRLSEINK